MDKAAIRKSPEQERYRPRKIVLDSEVYCRHSVRQSDGDIHCDHDFEAEPNVVEARFAIWNCTICGRAFRFDAWSS
ncbi:MAG TPA: hypothetical protein VGY49_16130 [Burkholderiaceae bacterium]|jgi:hypothetical protein|nr:hypothetical protein [Burkholderiaceae bacterium]